MIIPVVIIDWNPVKFVAMLRSESHDNLQQQEILCLTSVSHGSPGEAQEWGALLDVGECPQLSPCMGPLVC